MFADGEQQPEKERPPLMVTVEEGWVVSPVVRTQKILGLL